MNFWLAAASLYQSIDRFSCEPSDESWFPPHVDKKPNGIQKYEK